MQWICCPSSHPKFGRAKSSKRGLKGFARLDRPSVLCNESLVALINMDTSNNTHNPTKNINRRADHPPHPVPFFVSLHDYEPSETEQLPQARTDSATLMSSLPIAVCLRALCLFSA
jgi:hypothetical protein